MIENSPTVILGSRNQFELAILGASLRLQGVNLVGEGDSVEMMGNLFRSLQPDVVIIDLQFCSIDFLEQIETIRKLNNELGIILLSVCEDFRLFGIDPDSLPYGTQIVLKKSLSDISIIKKAISFAIVAAINLTDKAWIDGRGSLHEKELTSILTRFTDIQVETFRLLATGYSNSEIARIRFVSEKAVEQIISKIAEHLGIQNDKGRNLRVILTGEYFKLLGAPVPY